MMNHLPVLMAEVREAALLIPSTAGLWGLDGTLGVAGHASLVLEAREELAMLGTDHDEQMLALATEELSRFGARACVRRARISEVGSLIESGDLPFEGQPSWMLFDLGVASVHLDQADRGFSFGADAELDMRMDRSREVTAADIVNTWHETDLADLFYNEGDERRSRQVAAAIVESRRRVPIRRTLGLADLVERVVGRSGKIHPATRVFQALRREVNRERAELDAAMQLAADHLAVGGLLAIISFHSGESREVKHWMADACKRGEFELLWKKPRRATDMERRENPRSRSAELRVVRKIAGGAA